MNFIHLRKMVLLHQANEATLVIRQVANSPPLTNFEHLAARKMGFDFKKRKFCVSAKNAPFLACNLIKSGDISFFFSRILQTFRRP